jgi:hypothetical protein
MKRLVQRVLIALAATFAVVYLGDWAVFQLRGAPHSTIVVQRYLTVPLKGNKEEFENLGPIEVPCCIALFSQDGKEPCWQLRRKAVENTKL